MRRVRIKVYSFLSFLFFISLLFLWTQELAARPLLNFLPNYGALVES